MSEESRRKMSESAKRKAPPSFETREKLRKSSTGRKHTAEALEKIKEARKRQRPPTLGFHHSPETILKMRKSAILRCQKEKESDGIS